MLLIQVGSLSLYMVPSIPGMIPCREHCLVEVQITKKQTKSEEVKNGQKEPEDRKTMKWLRTSIQQKAVAVGTKRQSDKSELSHTCP